MVIVGGGLGGIMAPKQLEKADIEVTIIDRSNDRLFQLLLYQVTAALSQGDIAAPIRTIRDESRNVDVLLGMVEKVHPEEKTLYWPTVWSAVTSLGMTRYRFSDTFYIVSIGFAILMAIGFLFIPLYIYFTGGYGALISY